jgi:hypothetical protein
MYPKKFLNIEKNIEEVKQRKSDAINAQKFEEAANFRDLERKLSLELERAKKRWMKIVVFIVKLFPKKCSRSCIDDDRQFPSKE